ncbi:TPA: dTDP-4-dehydrorhamnose 3,5-epimerase [Candidatus Micrarchaeota archaeon]|nr:dTDP-4-dehydrorhamnose 3,5-epimerase [Candidatus Micrarchaeota archaeon]
MGIIKIEKLPLEGSLLLHSFRISDSRGEFVKQADAALLEELSFSIRDVFYSASRKNVVRGLHYQLPHPQTKMVFCPKGAIFDVMVDLRRNSETYGKWHGEVLSEKNSRAAYVPKGFAHGFASLEEGSITVYLADEKYEPENDTGLRYDDADVGIGWKIRKGTEVVSKRDRAFPFLKNAEIYD